MAPKSPEPKRKRGRPAGASKPAGDASRRDQDHVDDPEEELRPQKRGRKSLKENVASNPDSQGRDQPARPGRRERPAKSKTLTSDAEAESPVDIHQRDQAQSKPSDNTKASEARDDEEPPSSELRRSGRQRRSYNAEEMYGARRANHSPTQFTSPPSDSSRMPPPPQRTKIPEPKSPSSTPRRSGRERRAWDADQLFRASRPTAKQQEDSAPATRKVMEKGKSTSRSSANAVDLKAKKLEATTIKQVTKQNHPSRMPRNQSPGEGPSSLRKGKRAQATQEAAISTADTAQPRRRGRPKRNSLQASEPSQPSRPRGRPPRARDEHDKERAPLKKSKRKPAVDDENKSESEEEDNTLPFRHLQETTRNIQRATISDKWTPLDPPSIDAVSNFLADAQRPVLLRLQNTSQRRGHASTALGVVIRRLRSRLVKGVPFPAPTAGATRSNAASHEDDFDFERTVDAMQTLENALNPLLHSVSLLKREIGKEESALARDYDSLHHLEKNAKAEAKEWRDKTRREHVLAPGLKRKGEQETASQNHLELVSPVDDGVLAGLFKDLEDEPLATLSTQIGSHMESMKANLQPLNGVVPAITKSKAALQQVLLKHLDDEHYESVLLG